MSSSGPKEPHEEGASSERWLISYADFITLMFAFFVILYATSEKDAEKSKEFQDSLKRYLIKAGAFGDSGQQVNQGDKHNSAIDSPIPTFKNAKPEATDMLDEAEAFLEDSLSKDDQKKYIMDIAQDEWGVRIVIPATALYASHSDKFRQDAIPFLTKLGALLAKSKRKVLVEGHVAANEVGSARSTWDFASARAINFLRFIQKSQKIPAERLATASLGDSRPTFQGELAANNSRIELVLLNADMNW